MSKVPMTRPDNCPHCGVSLIGEPLPSSLYGGNETPWRREVGCEVQGAFDGVLFWKCPDCGGTWQRFDLTSPLHHVAKKYMRGKQGWALAAERQMAEHDRERHQPKREEP